MQEVRLTARKRAFPSQGRVRFNIAHLPALEIRDGDRVELVSEATGKTVTTSVIADTQVREGQIRVSDEDLKTLGLDEDAEILVRKATPLSDKLKKAASDANKSLSKTAGDLDRAATKAGKKIGADAAEAAESIKKGTKKAADSVGKAAEKTVSDVKKAVKKATGEKDTL